MSSGATPSAGRAKKRGGRGMDSRAFTDGGAGEWCGDANRKDPGWTGAARRSQTGHSPESPGARRPKPPPCQLPASTSAPCFWPSAACSCSPLSSSAPRAATTTPTITTATAPPTELEPGNQERPSFSASGQSPVVGRSSAAAARLTEASRVLTAPIEARRTLSSQLWRSSPSSSS